MKTNKIAILLVFALLSVLNLNAQNEEKPERTALQKVIIDFEAKPLHYNTSGNEVLTSYGFALGYELSDKFDLRFGISKVNLYNEYLILGRRFNSYYAAQFASKYKLFSEFNSVFNLKSNLYLIGKAGISFNEHREQEFFIFDLATHLDFNTAPYFGFGYNYLSKGSILFREINGVYFVFGFEF